MDERGKCARRRVVSDNAKPTSDGARGRTARLRAVAIYGPGAGVFAGTPCPEVGVPHTEAAGGFHPRRAADAGWEPPAAGAGSTGFHPRRSADERWEPARTGRTF